MQDPEPETISHGSFFVEQGFLQSILGWNSQTSDESVDSPYMLGM